MSTHAPLPVISVEEIERLLGERQAEMRRSAYITDGIRDLLAGRGITIEDTPAGARWSRK